MEKLDIKITLDKDLHTLFKKYCKENGYTMGGIIKKLIKAELKK